MCKELAALLPRGWGAYDVIVPLCEVKGPLRHKGDNTWSSGLTERLGWVFEEIDFYRGDIDWVRWCTHGNIQYVLHCSFIGWYGRAGWYPRVHFHPGLLRVEEHKEQLYLLLSLCGHVDSQTHRTDRSLQHVADGIGKELRWWFWRRFLDLPQPEDCSPSGFLQRYQNRPAILKR